MIDWLFGWVLRRLSTIIQLYAGGLVFLGLGGGRTTDFFHHLRPLVAFFRHANVTCKGYELLITVRNKMCGRIVSVKESALYNTYLHIQTVILFVILSLPFALRSAGLETMPSFCGIAGSKRYLQSVLICFYKQFTTEEATDNCLDKIRLKSSALL